MMKTQKSVLLVLVALLISGCMSQTPDVTVTVETSFFNSLSTTSTPPLATPLPTVDVDAIEMIVAAPSYLWGCKKLNPSTYNEQAIYKGIVPGKTTSVEVNRLVGRPRRIIVIDWVYDGFGISFKDKVVSEINVVESPPSILEIVETYGCPDAIFAYHLYDEDNPSLETLGTFGMATFVYCHIGLEFEIWHYPVKLIDRVEIVRFYAPKSLHDYVYDQEFREYLLETPGAIKLVSWDDAVEK